MKSRERIRAVWIFALVFLVAVSAAAQVQTGNIFGRAVGTDGAALPGVTVTLTGIGAPQTTVTDSQGNYRFLNLSPGVYTLKAELAGYGSVSRAGISVNLGRNADVTLALNPAVTDTITVTGEAPLLDVRRTGTGAVLTQEELDAVPSARDPWVILQQVPGVLVDRMNVGGNESGQQSNFVSKGVDSDQATFSVDGVNTTDMIATGGSSSYFDFGSFEEIQVATGGTDPRVQTPGAQINMVTKRGTNDFSGAGRYYLTDGSTQAPGTVPSEATGYLTRTNEINEVTEWGVDAGGPIIRDRLWLWGAYADNRVNLFVAQPPSQAAQGLRFKDDTILETLNLKLNAQVTRNNSATLFYYNNSKEKFGRDASPTRPPETVWNQGSFGPRGTYKIEDTHIFSSNFYLTGLYSRVNGGFQLQPDVNAGCKTRECFLENSTKAFVTDFGTGAVRNTYFSVQNERPQDQYRADGSAFFTTGAMNHELKFGFGYRKVGSEGLTTFAFDQSITDLGPFFNSPGLGLTTFYAIGAYDYDYEYGDLYVGDTMLWGNLTLQAGFRFDQQKGSAPTQTGPGNALVPEWLPAMTSGEIETMEWETISPRIGLTWAVGSDKKTLLRAAYNRYADQMGSNASGYTNAISVQYRAVSFYTMDANANDIIDDRSEIVFAYGLAGFAGFDPENPSSNLAVTRIDPDIEPVSTDEFILGFERELLQDFVVGVNYTHRDLDNFLWLRPEKTRGSGDFYTAADYELVKTLTNPVNASGASTVPEVDPYTIDVYRLKANVPAQKYFVLSNQGGYSQSYDGLELSLVKRMSNRWMARGNFSFNNHDQNVDDEGIIDPSRTRANFGCATCDGAEVVSGSGTGSGSKGNVWMNSKWSMNLSGVYQIPFIETNFGANFTMRQGYPILYVHQVDLVEGQIAGVDNFVRKNVLIDSDVTRRRLENPYSLDLRLAKDFRFRGVGLELSVDAFNVTNRRTVLQRDAVLARTTDTDTEDEATTARGAHNRIREMQSPRIFRFGARVTF